MFCVTGDARIIQLLQMELLPEAFLEALRADPVGVQTIGAKIFAPGRSANKTFMHDDFPFLCCEITLIDPSPEVNSSYFFG
jgi:hypothetical protein